MEKSNTEVLTDARAKVLLHKLDGLERQYVNNGEGGYLSVWTVALTWEECRVITKALIKQHVPDFKSILFPDRKA